MNILARLACLLLLTGCATARPPQATGLVTVAPPAPDLTGVLALVGKDAFAHACPIAADLALTNGHVVDGISLIGERPIHPLMWESRGVLGVLGGEGLTERNPFRDLAFVRPSEGEFPKFYVVAKEPPAVGERVWFLGYDFRKRKAVLAPRVFDAEVVRVRVGHIAFYRAGVKGSSGSCVLNARDEVVAVNQALIQTEDDAELSGIGVGVWAGLLDLGRSK